MVVYAVKMKEDMMENLQQGMSLKEYATTRQISYEAVRKMVKKLTDESDLLNDHIYEVGRTRYLDDEGVTALDHKRAKQVIVTETEPEEVLSLRKEIKELKDERDLYKEKNHALTSEMLELQKQLKDSPAALDTTKYMLIEDHAKTEEELKLKSERLEYAEEKLKDVNKAKDDMEKMLASKEGLIKKIADRNKEQEEEIKEQKKIISDSEVEISAKNELIAQRDTQIASVNAQNDDLSAEIEKMRQEMAELEKARDEASREAEENLNLGFFARLRKRKEKKSGNI